MTIKVIRRKRSIQTTAIPTTTESACASPTRERGRGGGLKLFNKCEQVRRDYHNKIDTSRACYMHTLM